MSASSPVGNDHPPRLARRRNRISLCMIVKDEEQFLGECLDSVLGVVDEIVVVDTGSTDKTVEIARSHDAAVVHFPWTEHFAEARNQGVEAAGGDFMLVLDADERLDPGTAHHIRAAVDRGEFDVAYLQFANADSGGATGRRWIAPRLYRLTPGLRYIGRVHEQVAQPLPEIRSMTLDALVLHYGYEQDVFFRRRKTERNTRLIEAALEDPEAENPLVRSNYLYHHAHMAKGAELLERFEGFVRYVRTEWPDELPAAPWITAGMAECSRLLHDAGRYGEAGELAEELLTRRGASPLLALIRARALIASGEVDAAEELLGVIVGPSAEIAPAHQQYSMDLPLVQGRARFLLGLIEESRANDVAVTEHFLAAYHEEPDQEVFWSTLLCMLTRLGRYGDALDLLDHSAQPAENTRPSLDCLGLALAVLTKSTGGLVFWGEKVRLAADGFSGARRLLDQLESRDIGRDIHLEDFTDIHQAVTNRADPAKFRLPQTVRRAELAVIDQPRRFARDHNAPPSETVVLN